MAHYHYEGEEYCDDCLAEIVSLDSPEVDVDYGEQDCPANCCQCHCPLDYSLTSEGVNYVVEKLKEALETGLDWTVYDCYKGTYYDSCPHCEILRDWADDLRWYGGLSEDDERIVNDFLEAYKLGVDNIRR